MKLAEEFFHRNMELNRFCAELEGLKILPERHADLNRRNDELIN